MKLYTEEQIREAYEDGYYDCKVGQDSHSYYYQNPNPIELPSDEDIEESETDSPYDRIDEYNYGFIDGANWVKQFIINQKK